MQPIILLFGGSSTEHDVSCRSVKFYLQNLDRSKYQIIPVGITKSGRWTIASLAELEKAVEADSPIDLTQMEKALVVSSIATTVANSLHSINESTIKGPTPIFIPVTHGGIEEGGALQGMLELMGFPYVGCSRLSSAVAMDKVLTKVIAKNANIPIIDYLEFSGEEYKGMPEEIHQKVAQNFSLPIFVKPINGGSSIGVSKVSKLTDLHPAIQEALKSDHRVLVEQGVVCRELEIAIMGDYGRNPTRVGEAIANSDFYSYAAKYSASSDSMSTIPADIPNEVSAKITTYASKLQEALRLDGMARLDFFYQEASGEVYLNEINTLPGFTSISQYPLLWKDAGLDASELLDELIGVATKRFLNRHNKA